VMTPRLAHATLVVRGPYLQLGTPSSVIVRWRTDTPTSTRIDWGTEPGSLVFSLTDTTMATEHEVTLTGLQSATRYAYAVGDAGGVLVQDENCTFVTPPPVGTSQPVRAWVTGDSGQPGPIQEAVRDAFLNYTGARGADLWLMLGDNAYNSGTDAEYQAGVFTPYAAQLRQWVLWPTRGNHDALHFGANSDYYDFFTLPALGQAGGVSSGTEAYYSYDYANVHFVCLDSEGSSRQPGSAMLTWLKADLAATSQDWIITYWHHPPYTKGSHDSDFENQLIEMRQNVVPVLDSLGADLCLTGHSHSYERSFLLRQHYGTSGTLADSMRVDDRDGRRDGDGPYQKPSPSQTLFGGAVYVVAGSSSKIGGGSLNHPVMVSSQNVAGSLVLDVNGGVLDGRFLDSFGAVTDSFTILKLGLTASPDGPSPASGFSIQGVTPRPSGGAVDIAYRLPRAGRVRVAFYDAQGRRVAVLRPADQPAGERRAHWNGRGADGGRLAAGVYFAVVEFEGERRATQVVLTP
jgi:hypothetical protein